MAKNVGPAKIQRVQQKIPGQNENKFQKVCNKDVRQSSTYITK
jgi:hypothetical protein